MTSTQTAVATGTWDVDALHSGIEFSVRHFFTPVTGRFEKYEIDLDFDSEEPANSSVEVRIDVSSIDTGNEDRDAHLQSADFFDAENHPYITFESTDVRSGGEDRVIVRGPLTIRGETHQVELPIDILGVKDLPEELSQAFGGIQQVASFQTGLEIDRSDYGVGKGSWAAAVVVGHDVEIKISIEANR
jgi:polyisoprenoid-binding protein YceI